MKRNMNNSLYLHKGTLLHFGQHALSHRSISFLVFKDYCLAASMLAFYFYLAVFFWMLVEGVYIYLMVVKVFRGNVTRKRRLAYIVGWGKYKILYLVVPYYMCVPNDVCVSIWRQSICYWAFNLDYIKRWRHFKISVSYWLFLNLSSVLILY